MLHYFHEVLIADVWSHFQQPDHAEYDQAEHLVHQTDLYLVVGCVFLHNRAANAIDCLFCGAHIESIAHPKLLQHAGAGGALLGICGGYQMLGRRISDPEGAEAAPGTELSGLGLLDMETVFRGDKVQTQTRGRFGEIEGLLSSLTGLSYEGYEIHMGRSREARPALTGKGNVYGTYIHGIFDAPTVADEVLKALCRRKGADFARLGAFDAASYRERQYDLLADAVRASLDMDLVYRSMGVGRR